MFTIYRKQLFKYNIRTLATSNKVNKDKIVNREKVNPLNETNGFASLVKPRLQLFGLHARYANALYSVCAKENTLESVEKELNIIQSLIHSNKNFNAFLKDPTIARHKKQAEMDGFIKECNFSKTVVGLFTLLAENGRLPETKKIIDTFGLLMSAYRKEVKAKIISAETLTNAQIKEVEKSLKSQLEPDETLFVSTEVDPNILGGLKIQIGNMFIDLSLATKISKIHKILSVPV